MYIQYTFYVYCMHIYTYIFVYTHYVYRYVYLIIYPIIFQKRLVNSAIPSSVRQTFDKDNIPPALPAKFFKLTLCRNMV